MKAIPQLLYLNDRHTRSSFTPVVAEVGHNIVHDINQQWDDFLLFVTVEDHVQQMSQHLTNKSIIHTFVAT